MGTNIELVNARGNTHIKLATCVSSGFFTDNPIVAYIHENENPNKIAKTIAGQVK